MTSPDAIDETVRLYSPDFYLSPEAAPMRERRLVEAIAREGLSPARINSEGFECAETVPPRIMVMVEAYRAGKLEFTNGRKAA